MRRNFWLIFIGILILTGIAGVIDWPNSFGIKWFENIKVHQGLDLKGGTHLTYQMDMAKIESGRQDQAATGTKNIIEARVNSLGVTEPVIQTTKVGGQYGLIVELPGISDIDQAKKMIGKTAQLEFFEVTNEEKMIPTGLSGKDFKRADPSVDQTGNPIVNFEFNSEATKKFADLTTKIHQNNERLAIKLDEDIIFNGSVKTPITNGQGIMEGIGDTKEARILAQLLNAGALPVPINLISERNIGPTLGVESVKKSLIAGMLGLLLVALFMIFYYSFPGLLAVIALIIYSLIVLALFKLIPVTLTLAGIAGFILSIGMAVDANILIFERMKEELRKEKPISLAIEEGFRRAWSSIRDSNFSSLITCAILYFTTTGLVRGFALTLAIGIIISMFTAIQVSRNFLRLVAGSKLEKLIYLK